jgi:membrane-anchored protein YejM (alkaline phosphatase superfamily)
LWDTAGTAREGLWAWLWATRRLLLALAGSAWLTWQEWVKHHPPEIAIVAVLHFSFVLIAIALLVYAGQWFSCGNQKPQGGE